MCCASESSIRLELKYCERCGGLWLRQEGTPLVYCHSCRPEMEELAVPLQRHRAGARRARLQAGLLVAGSIASLIVSLSGLAWLGWCA